MSLPKEKGPVTPKEKLEPKRRKSLKVQGLKGINIVDESG